MRVSIERRASIKPEKIHREYTYRIHLEVNQLAPGKGDHHLTLINGAFDNGLLARCLPLIDALIRANMTNAVRVNLKVSRRV